MPITKIDAVNYPKRCKNCTDENFSGLTNSIYLCKECRVCLTSNIWTTTGLVNGANGYIRVIIYDPQNTSNNLPKAIFIEFDQ